LRVDHQRPGERLARVIHAAHAHQPARRFRDPVADHEHQHERHQADQEQAAPADHRQELPRDKSCQDAAGRQHRRHQRADPAALVGGDEFLHQRQVDRIDAGIADADKYPEERQEQPARDKGVRSRGENHDAGSQRDRDRRQNEHRAPADAVAEPAPDEGAGRGADAGGHEDHAALPIGQRPFLGQRRGDVADQKKIEEIQQIGQVGCANQLPLIGSQLLLPLQKFYHYVLPCSTRWPDC
jgi:hypothetical protein